MIYQIITKIVILEKLCVIIKVQNKKKSNKKEKCDINGIYNEEEFNYKNDEYYGEKCNI